MLTLYHCINARSFRPLWALCEMGLDFELKMLPFPPRYLAREYLEVNPLGTIPLLIDGETRMTESAAICHYLATRYGPSPLAVGVNEADYGAYLNWLVFGEATLTFPQTLVLRYTRLEPEERRSAQVAEDYERWFLGRLRAVEAEAARAETLCAGRFTMADISVGYAVMLAEEIGLGDKLPALVTDYWLRLKGRPGFQQALHAQQRAAEAQGIAPVSAA